MKGEAAFLNCDTLGDPDPEVTWKKDDVILDPTSDLDITMTPFGSLEFSKVEVADDGRYVCIATNPAGSAVKDFILIVQGGYTSDRTLTTKSDLCRYTSPEVRDPSFIYVFLDQQIPHFSHPSLQITPRSLKTIRSLSHAPRWAPHPPSSPGIRMTFS